VHTQDRPEVLGGEDLVLRVRALDHRRPDEPALAVVRRAAGDDGAGRRVFHQVERGGVLGERPRVDDRAAEVGEVGDVAVRQRVGGGGEPVADAALPQRTRHVRPRGSRALLALVLERAPDERGDERVRLGAGVRDDEVLAAGLADQSRVRPVSGEVLPDGPPQRLERLGGAGEMDAGQVGVGERHLGHGDAVAGHHVDDTGRQAGRVEEPHREVRGELLGRRGLPHHGVAHQRGRRGQVAGDRGEVERGDRVHEAFERAVVEAVPHARRGERLLAEQLLSEVDVEAQEVDELAGGVYLRLVHRLGLAEDRSAVDRVAPRSGEKVSRAQEDGGPIGVRQGVPHRRRFLRGRHR
jgi:hypothetical protein